MSASLGLFRASTDHLRTITDAHASTWSSITMCPVVELYRLGPRFGRETNDEERRDTCRAGLCVRIRVAHLFCDQLRCTGTAAFAHLATDTSGERVCTREALSLHLELNGKGPCLVACQSTNASDAAAGCYCKNKGSYFLLKPLIQFLARNGTGTAIIFGCPNVPSVCT